MPRQADRTERRSEIVHAATSLIARGGPEAFTMRGVANELGCTIGQVNHWFDSKDDLIEAVLDRAAESAVRRSAQLVADPDASLADVLCEFLPLDEDRADELKIWLVFWALSIGRPTLRDAHSRRVAGIRRDLGHILAAQGVIESRSESLVDAMMSAIDGVAVNSIADPSYWTVERQVGTLRWLLERVGVG